MIGCERDQSRPPIALLKFGSSLGMLSTTTILCQFLSTEHHLLQRLSYISQAYTV
ncbi:hypothetical protein YC2023_114734 [Brassica napus]|uniref:Uncharacterized protein n=2 Tax=Brassica TaxID=3705 RepID=A0A3P6E9Z8_BRAOL|nr:unnamed protein product [Brassica napus]VDD29362.1 unnamed protein product [Brassica oleracea]